MLQLLHLLGIECHAHAAAVRPVRLDDILQWDLVILIGKDVQYGPSGRCDNPSVLGGAVPQPVSLVHGVITTRLYCTVAAFFPGSFVFVGIYNFYRPHSTLSGTRGKRTPAMELGLTDRVWSMRELKTVSYRQNIS